MSRKNTGVPTPQSVNGLTTLRTYYYYSELRRLIKGLFDVSCPIEWDDEYIINTLITYGYFAIAESDDVGIGAFQVGLQGANYMQNPTRILVQLPYIKNFSREINENCVLYYLEHIHGGSYYNFNEKLRVTAQRLANADASIDVNLINSRVAYIIEAETKAQSESIKAMYDKITSGEPMVVYRKDAVLGGDGLKALFGNVKQNFVANDVLDAKRTIMNEFLTSIGINNANTDKKERLITDEVNANDEELDVYTELWKNNLEKANKRVKKMFPAIDFSVKLKKFDSRTLEKMSSSIVNGG